ncbi:MAG: poly-gamma-glutamate biosynthesis protein PgsC/CapC [Verrucomicrobiales bacterium]
MTILVAYLLRMAFDYTMAAHVQSLSPDAAMVVIGYIIPGLIALWLDRQGIVETLSTLAAASVVVRIASSSSSAPSFTPESTNSLKSLTD